MVAFTQVEKTMLSLLDDLRVAQAAHSNGFNIESQLDSISKQYEMDREDLNSINFDD